MLKYHSLLNKFTTLWFIYRKSHNLSKIWSNNKQDFKIKKKVRLWIVWFIIRFSSYKVYNSLMILLLRFMVYNKQYLKLVKVRIKIYKKNIKISKIKWWIIQFSLFPPNLVLVWFCWNWRITNAQEGRWGIILWHPFHFKVLNAI
jgi:hypothetical protein